MKTLLDECLAAIESDALDILIEPEVVKSIKKNTLNLCEFNLGSGIDWSKHQSFNQFDSSHELMKHVADEFCYIIWDNYSLPIIRARLCDVISNIDDVSAVAFDTWLFGTTDRWVMELYHEGTIRFSWL